MKKFSLSLLLIIFTTFLFAQGPIVTNVFPANQAITVADDASIYVTFDQALDLSTIDYGTFKVFGRWSGPMPVAFSMSNNDQTVELIPELVYSAGEWVTVTISKGLKGVNGENMEQVYSWNFWIATSPNGTLEQGLIQTIELRQTGETLVQPYGAYAGDLNNDGYSDLTVVNENTDDLRILLNDGAGNYSDDFEIITMGSDRPSPTEGADFNSDGEIDLVVVTVDIGEVRILFGDGNGSFVLDQTYFVGEALRGVIVTDLDGDGNDDIVATNRDGNNLAIYVNDGTGQFTSSELDVDPAGDGENSCAISDVNHDGIPDMFVGYYDSEEVAIYLGDGAGGFTLSAKRAVTGKPWMLAAGDLNGDGHADVASANSTGDNMTVLFGDGNGNLSLPIIYTYPNTEFPLAVDLGDLDGDGDLDIVTSNYSSADFLVFENNGQGAFSVNSILETTGNASCAILHDRDNDGDLDITATDETDDLVLIFINEIPNNTSNISDDLSVTIFPNPFEGTFTMDYVLEESTFVKIELLNVLGVKIAELQNKFTTAGKHQFQWTSDLANGVYILQIEVVGKTQSYRVIAQ